MEDPFVHKGSRDALLGKPPAPDLVYLLSIEKHVRKGTPPMFLVATMADQWSLRSTRLGETFSLETRRN